MDVSLVGNGNKKTARGDGIDLLWGNRAVKKERKTLEPSLRFFPHLA
jgi:hypothetical protein